MTFLDARPSARAGAEHKLEASRSPLVTGGSGGVVRVAGFDAAGGVSWLDGWAADPG